MEKSKQRWFLIAGRPVKTAGSLLDKAKPGTIETFGVNIITHNNIFLGFFPDDVGLTNINIQWYSHPI